MIGSDPFLVALRNIEAGEELSYDYSLTSTDTPDSWQMSCGCGHRECRGVISGFGTVPPAVQDAYVKMGAVPSYVFRAGTYRRS
jgi:hypothetical protein